MRGMEMERESMIVREAERIAREWEVKREIPLRDYGRLQSREFMRQMSRDSELIENFGHESWFQMMQQVAKVPVGGAVKDKEDGRLSSAYLRNGLLILSDVIFNPGGFAKSSLGVKFEKGEQAERGYFTGKSGERRVSQVGFDKHRLFGEKVTRWNVEDAVFEIRHFFGEFKGYRYLYEVVETNGQRKLAVTEKSGGSGKYIYYLLPKDREEKMVFESQWEDVGSEGYRVDVRPVSGRFKY